MALLGIIPQSIVADVSEADGIITGENREGMFLCRPYICDEMGQSIAMLVFTSFGKSSGPRKINRQMKLRHLLWGLTIIAFVALHFASIEKSAIVLGAYREKHVMKTISEKNKNEKD